MRSLFVRARHVRLGTLGALCSFVLLIAIGCGDSGNGGSPVSEVAAVATTPIDLPPGQTSALLAWEPSQGQVSAYLVFQARGTEGFRFLNQVTEPEIQITGTPGDSIRILVVAQGIGNSQSVASDPSPPVRFHAALEANSAEAIVSAEAAIPAAPLLATSPSDTTSVADTRTQASSALSDPADEAMSEPLSNAANRSNGVEDDVVLIDQALREQLLRSDARFPFRGLPPGAGRWVQSFVDAQVGAGVSLAGSGKLDDDGLRELIWVDTSGQLFVSDGARVSTTEDLPDTFVEAIRLRPTERFAGLADFEGDGVGEWIVEDTATGDVWILSGEGQDAQSIQNADADPDLRVVGHGDFDGDGRTELLWQHTDSSFWIGRPASGSPDLIEWVRAENDSTDSTHADSQLLTIADLDGDGLDDLLFRGSDGRLELALSVSDSFGPRFEWNSGPETSTDGLELIATLDLDFDGRAEIAWWSEGTLEIWDLQ